MDQFGEKEGITMVMAAFHSTFTKSSNGCHGLIIKKVYNSSKGLF